jgi:hypothetical protein
MIAENVAKVFCEQRDKGKNSMDVFFGERGWLNTAEKDRKR